jgi:hypothetical protein
VPLAERCELLAALAPVDAVFAISGSPELDPVPAYARLLWRLQPAALAFTAGDSAERGRRLVAARLRADVFVAPLVDGRSTTLLVEHASQLVVTLPTGRSLGA